MDLLENLGRKILAKREAEGLGLRKAAESIGTTHATLSRIEKGFLPDIRTYEKIRKWLGETEGALSQSEEIIAPQVHFRREKTIGQETAQSLAQMILRAQQAWGLSRNSSELNE